MHLAISPTTKEILISRGLESFIIGSYYEAAAHFEEVLSNTPNDPVALHHLAGCQIQLQEYESALETIQKVLHLDAKNSLAWFRMGQIHYTCKRYELAIDSFGKAIEIKPEFADAWFMGGQALMQNGAINDGMLALKNALTINPSSPIFNEVYGRQFIDNKKNIGTLFIAGGVDEIHLCLPFLIKNRKHNIKVTLITDYEDAESLLRKNLIHIDKFLVCKNTEEISKLKNQISKKREYYPCPKAHP